MSTIKVVMDITLPGSVMYTREQAKVAPKKFTSHSAIKVSYKAYDKATHKKVEKEEILHIFPRRCMPAHQSINMSVEAYDWMISVESCPTRVKLPTWKAMSWKERLEYHLSETCHDMGGSSFEYEVLED